MRLLMLARAAIVLMRAPPNPFSENSLTAAPRIAALVRCGSRVAGCFAPARSALGFDAGRSLAAARVVASSLMRDDGAAPGGRRIFFRPIAPVKRLRPWSLMKPQKSAGREFLLNVAAARRHRRRLYSNKISRRHSALAGDGPSAGGANEPRQGEATAKICNQLVIKQSRTGFNPRIPSGFAASATAFQSCCRILRPRG